MAVLETLQASLKEVEDKAYDEDFEKTEKATTKQILVNEGFFFKKGWYFVVVEAKALADSRLFSNHVVTIPSL